MASTEPAASSETGRRLLRFKRLLQTQDSAALLQAAGDLFSCPTYAQDLGDSRLRDPYVDALFVIADLFESTPDNEVISPYGLNKPPLPDSVISSTTIGALERAYSFDDGHIRTDRNSSGKQAAAFNLGKVFEKASCHNTAVFWFRRSLQLARSVDENETVLLNLQALARNLNTSGNYDEARLCYDEMLRRLEDLPLAQRVSGGLAHAALFDLQHGDLVRGEAIMGTLAADALRIPSSYFGPCTPAVCTASAPAALPTQSHSRMTSSATSIASRDPSWQATGCMG